VKAAILTSSVSRKAGGIFEATRRLAHGLNDKFIQTSIVGLQDEFTKADRDLWRPLSVEACQVLGPRQFGYAPSYSATLERFNPDLAHLQGLWMYPSIAALGWTKRNRKPHLISPHGMLDSWALRNSSWKKRAASVLFEKNNLQAAACLHSLCESEALAIRACGLNNPIAIIPNGIDLPSSPPKAPSPWQESLGNSRKVLLYLGRLHPKKNLPNLLMAWKQMILEDSRFVDDWILAIAGWDQLGHELELRNLVHSENLDSSVRFLGPLFGDSKSAAFHQCHSFILPSLSEGLPIVVLEAWSHRKPVLITPQCNLPEGIQTGAAISIGSDSPGILAGLRTLASSSQADLDSMGGLGHQLVTERFTWPRIADLMSKVYGWVLGGGTQPDCVRTV
jgi:glycosyltransferase involved in cell wall biosynthesis